MGELSKILMNLLATEEKNSTNYIIASYVMSNINTLKKSQNLTTGYLAKQCNVSKASISRFCRDIGTEDFYTFKYMLKNFYPTPTVTKKYTFLEKSSNVKEAFIDTFNHDLGVFLDKINQEQIDVLTKEIHEAKRVIIMGHQQSFAMGVILQNDFATGFSKYMIVSGEPSEQVDYLLNSTKDDLIIVISATGTFFNHAFIKSKMHKRLVEAKLYMLTTNENIDCPYVDEMIEVAKSYDYPSTILMNMYIGLISSNYYRLYGMNNHD